MEKQIICFILSSLMGFSLLGQVPQLIDKKASRKTQALYQNLSLLSQNGVLFGHQDDLAYGVHWKESPRRSDVKDVCGSYPAVYGWDISKLGREINIDSVRFDNMKMWIKEGFRRGGINTISWHIDNPVSGGDSWDTTRAVYAILPGGEKHEFYKARLDTVADFIKSLKVGLFGTQVPIIFRLFHEHNGHWFWWGAGHCTPEEYKALWRFTVEYLRDEKKLHQIIYAYSTDAFNSKEEYLTFYPGDDYVDVLGFDDYQSIKSADRAKTLSKRLREVSEMAKEKNKIAALSETGLESIPITNWWTNILLKNIKADPMGSQIAWVLVWRNANTKHHYAPYQGHPTAADFKEFKKDQFTIFEDDLPKIYKALKNKNSNR